MSDEDGIRRTLARYALAHDALDLEGYLALFTQEGRYVSRGVVHEGRDALRSFIGGIYAKRAPEHRMQHLYANSVIEVRGDTAHATSDFIAYERAAEGAAWQVNMLGQCADRLVKQDGVWLFTERRPASNGRSSLRENCDREANDRPQTRKPPAFLVGERDQ